MRGHIIRFYRVIWKIIPLLSLLFGALAQCMFICHFLSTVSPALSVQVYFPGSIVSVIIKC